VIYDHQNQEKFNPEPVSFFSVLHDDSVGFGSPRARESHSFNCGATAMSSILITGSASGIGAAIRDRLLRQGHRVIGVDLRNADIEANLSSEAGRRALQTAAEELATQGLDGVVACAGIGRPDRPADTIAVNYFGAVATLEGLRPLLARSSRPRAVAICSTAAMLPVDETVLSACLSGDERTALAQITARPANAYATSKRALSLWLRRTAVTKQWAGAGILLNGVAPGVVETPMTASLLNDPQMTTSIQQTNPIAVDGHGRPDEIAELVCYLLGFEGHNLLGQIIFIDGGTDALLRPELI
jgi:NAD(P)-dependent dehydrogenase (short-subunit alcohol dehydrogenase family)